MNKKLFKDTFIYGISYTLSKYINVFLLPVYTKLFSPSDYGILELLMASINIACVFGLLQIESGVSRYFYEYENEGKLDSLLFTSSSTVLVLSIVLTLIIFLFIHPLSGIVFGREEHSDLLKAGAILIPIFNLSSILGIVLRFKNQPFKYVIYSISQTLFSIGFIVLYVIVLKWGIMGVLIGQLSGFVVGDLIALTVIYKDISFSFDINIMKKIFKYSIPMVPASAGNWINNYANRFLINEYLSTSEVGIYSIAIRIGSAMGLIQNAFNLAWEPFFWKIIYEENHEATLKNLFKKVIVVIIGISLLIGLFSKEIIMLLTNPRYYTAANFVMFITFAQAINISSLFTGMGPSIKNLTIINTILYFLGVVINIGLLIIFLPRYKLYVVPISYLISVIIIFILFWIISEKLYFIGYSKLFFGLIFLCSISIILLSSIFNLGIFLKLIIGLIIVCYISYLWKDQLIFIINRLKLNFNKFLKNSPANP